MRIALIGAAVLAAAAFAPLAMAQAVISDPGYCAQFYPNANCQNLGAGNPYTDGGYWQNDNAYNAYVEPPAPRVRRHHHRSHR